MVIEFVKVGNNHYHPYSSRSGPEYVYGEISRMYTDIGELIKDVTALNDIEGEKNNPNLEELLNKNLINYRVLLERLTDMAKGYFDPTQEVKEVKPMPKEVITAISDIISKKLPKNMSELVQTYHNSECEGIPSNILDKIKNYKENGNNMLKYIDYTMLSFSDHERIVDTYERLELAANPNTYNQIVKSSSMSFGIYEEDLLKGNPVALTEEQIAKLTESCKKYLEKPLEREDLKRNENIPELLNPPKHVDGDQLDKISEEIRVNTNEVLGYLYTETKENSKEVYDRAYIGKNREILEDCANYKRRELRKKIDSRQGNSVFLEYDSKKKEYVFDIKDKAIQRVRNNKLYTYRKLYKDGLNGKKTKIDLNTFFDEHLDEIDNYLAQDYILEHANNPNAELYSFDKINKFVKDTIKREKQQNKNDKGIIHNIIRGLRSRVFNEGVKDINKKINESKNKQQTNEHEQQGPSIDE